MNGGAKEVILGRVDSALGELNPSDAVAANTSAILAEWSDLPRSYASAALLSPADRLDLLEDRLRDYDAEVTRVAGDKIAAAVAAILAARGALHVVVPKGFPDEWKPEQNTITVDEGLNARELDRFDSVVTGATLAIAETGTLVLQNVPREGRRAASLIPDFHLCVVYAGDVVETVPEAFARLAETSTLPTTFVSGPSATADIEMTRVKGVHGPRFLHVLLVIDAGVAR